MMNTKQDMNQRAERGPEYTLADCGCYVDSARGIYAADMICSFAEDHGKRWEKLELFANEDSSDLTLNDDAEDISTSYMNDNYGVEGAYWGRNENGDWGLWEIDDYE